MSFAWDAFLTRYAPMARALARSLVRPPATPDDVVQEASLALHRALAREPQRFAEPAHARNYFLRAVRNLAAKTQRGAGREETLASEAPAVDPEDPAARAVREHQRTLGLVLRELAPAERELIARRFLAGQTLAEIARETGVPISTLHDRERALLAEIRRRCARLEDVDQEAAG